MSSFFKRRRGLIIVRARVWNARGSLTLNLALDTGASDTLISAARLEEAGFDLAASSQTVQITTGSGLATAPIIEIARLQALDGERLNFPVLAHNLPPTATIDGLLGLDFMRDHLLTVDFRTGQLSLI